MPKSVLLIAGSIALVRVSALALLVLLEETGKQSLSELPLVLLLYPEGLLLPYKPGTLLASWVILALLLVAGSFIATGALYFLGKFIRRNAS
jgi:hypothetical protein